MVEIEVVGTAVVAHQVVRRYSGKRGGAYFCGGEQGVVCTSVVQNKGGCTFVVRTGGT